MLHSKTLGGVCGGRENRKAKKIKVMIRREAESEGERE